LEVRNRRCKKSTGRLSFQVGHDLDAVILRLESAQRPEHPPSEIALDGWPSLGYVSWTSDGKSLVVGSHKNREAALLNVDLQGKINLLWEQHGAFGVSGVPSPDGRHIAIRLWTTNNNIWMADNP
jgi:hypothetical protein